MGHWLHVSSKKNSDFQLIFSVMTSVDRDDIPDGGSSHFAKTVQEVKKENPELLVECLVPDWRGDLAATSLVANSGLVSNYLLLFMCIQRFGCIRT